MSERKLATIRRISQLLPIEGADKIEVAVVDGWKVVVKKGEYRVNELIVYLEIDSWVPHALAPFLTKSGHYPKVYNAVEGQRLKTVKLRGQLSQGLILPISHCIEVAGCTSSFDEGDDVSEWLGIQKWEKEIPASLQGVQRGNFPSDIPKTNQERVQNIRNIETLISAHSWETTEKLHGSSATYYLDKEGVFHVCSRNVDLVETEGNTYWDIAKKYNIEENLRDLCDNRAAPYTGRYGIAIQGEIVGPGINGNQYGKTEAEFYVFDMYDSFEGTYCPAHHRIEIAHFMGLKHVPVLSVPIDNWQTAESLLSKADGVSMLNSSKREGLVFKSIDDPSVSFKVVSNAWLADGGEDQ